MLTLIKGDAKVSSKSTASLSAINCLSEDDYAMMRIQRLLWDAVRKDEDSSAMLKEEHPEVFAFLTETNRV